MLCNITPHLPTRTAGATTGALLAAGVVAGVAGAAGATGGAGGAGAVTAGVAGAAGAAMGPAFVAEENIMV
jgi:hypothetical protein